MIRRPTSSHGIDGDAVVREALQRIAPPSRRAFLQRSLTLGGIAMLTGCDLVDDASVESALMKV